ncbi:MAG: tetratricopeptide repeat protein [Flavobacteriales bacterium]|jgi:tetratricopeptide (TPR) repeat protein|nr:tetratricopeptide repeat protein [Flavobacteriales bacterium]
MSADRLMQLRAWLAEEPGDAFLRYAIALELKRLGESEQAIASLESLLGEKPEHIPSYYQLAVLLAELSRFDEAIACCEAGMLRCIVAGDQKARNELAALKEGIADA